MEESFSTISYYYFELSHPGRPLSLQSSALNAIVREKEKMGAIDVRARIPKTGFLVRQQLKHLKHEDKNAYFKVGNHM